MKKAIDSILLGGTDVEIIIIDDGSTDCTGEIADEYERDNPSIVKVIHQPNSGHGGGVNAGIKNASGIYFKVVDSDDWIDKGALEKLLISIRHNLSNHKLPDLYITNYVYEHTYDNKTHTIRYDSVMTPETFVTFKDIKTFKLSKFFMMHSITYRLAKLKESGLVLPEHTFYVDNIYAYYPIPFMKSIYYLDVDLYHYTIGRQDQSVNKSNFIKRYDQQNRVMKNMFYSYSYDEIKAMDKHLARYMFHNLSIIILNTMLFMTAGHDNVDERKRSHEELLGDFKQHDPKLYRKLKYRSYYALLSKLPWKMQRLGFVFGYKLVCKFVKVG
jgi:glycosyltransferase involved in cell wall biosynthesis